MGGGPSLPAAPKAKSYSYTAFDPNQLDQTSAADANTQAMAGDAGYYAASDADYARRNPQLVAANQIDKQQTLDEISGQVPAAVQSQWAKAGLAGALSSVGGDVAPGSAGEAGVARSIGVDALSYEDRARQHLAALDASNPQRSMGLTGAEQEGITMANQGAKNAVKLANNAGINQAAAANTQQANNLAGQAYQAQASAAASSAGSSSSMMSGIGSIVGMAAMFAM
jgi:hypothetical protein